MIKKKCVILGGGFTGLATAYFLKKKIKEESLNVDLTVLEASDRPGGILQSVNQDGFLFEKGPDAFISDPDHALKLLREIGMEDQILPTSSENRHSYVACRNRLCRVPEGFYLFAPTGLRPLVDAEFLNLFDKIRIAAERWIPSRKLGNEESLGSFIRRRYGRGMYDRFGQAMAGGIYSGDPDKLSLHKTLSRFREMEKEWGSLTRALKNRQNSDAVREASGPRYSLFVSLRLGMQSFTDALAAALEGVSIRCRTKIQSLTHSANWRIGLSDGEIEEADIIISALPAYVLARLIDGDNPALAELLLKIPYESVLTYNMGFKEASLSRRPEGFGFIVPKIYGNSITGCTFASNKFQGRAPKEHVLIRAFSGGAAQRALLEKDDEEIKGCILKDMRSILGIQDNPETEILTRWKAAMPQYYMGHGELVEEILSSVRSMTGFYVSGNYLSGVGLPELSKRAEEQAGVVVKELKSGAALHE